MRKFLLLSISILFSISAGAYDFKVDGLCYNYNSDGTSVTLTYESNPNDSPYRSYLNLNVTVTIPANVT